MLSQPINATCRKNTPNEIQATHALQPMKATKRNTPTELLQMKYKPKAKNAECNNQRMKYK